jgi:cell wall-associated NlpC family hydrolase
MTINLLQAYAPATALPAPGTQNKSNANSSSFNALLSSLRAGTRPDQAGQQAAADLFRIEMMQKSLSLSGDTETDRPGALPPLEALLAGSAQFRPADRNNPFSGLPAAPAQQPLPKRQASALASAGSWAGSGAGLAAGSVVEGTGVTGAKVPAANQEPAGWESTAARYLGTPYRFGGESADGIDCSSFVQQVFREHQVNLPRTAREQSTVGSPVAPGDLRKGDLVFFHTYADYPSHVGIYLGDGKMIHASSGKGEVTVSDLNSDYYRSRYLGAQRVA